MRTEQCMRFLCVTGKRGVPAPRGGSWQQPSFDPLAAVPSSSPSASRSRFASPLPISPISPPPPPLLPLPSSFRCCHCLTGAPDSKTFLRSKALCRWTKHGSSGGDFDSRARAFLNACRIQNLRQFCFASIASQVRAERAERATSRSLLVYLSIVISET